MRILIWSLAFLLLMPGALGQNETDDGTQNGTQDGVDDGTDPDGNETRSSTLSWTTVYAINGVLVLGLLGAFVVYSRK